MTANHRPCQPEFVTLDQGARLTLWHQALPASLHENLYRELENALAWRQPVVRVFGRDHLTPRLTTWEGDNHGVSGKMIPGAENGKTEFSGDRCDPESDFLTWLFNQKKGS